MASNLTIYAEWNKMPKCARCEKSTFDGKRWKSATLNEFNGKYLCLSCYQETEKDLVKHNMTLDSQRKQQQIENQKETLNLEIENCKTRITKLSTIYADGKISEDSYITTSKALEDKLKSLESMKSKNDFSTFSNSSLNQPTSVLAITEKHTSAWYLAPIFFGIIGGLIGYVVVKDDDKDFANNLLGIGVIAAVLGFIAIWGLYSWIISNTFNYFYYP